MITKHVNVATASNGLNDQDATEPAGTDYTTPVQDCYSMWTAAWTFKFAGTSGANLTLTMEGSNDPPPDNYALDGAWKPADDSWEQIYSGGLPVTLVVTADGPYTLSADLSGLQLRWNRLVMTVNTPGGGTVQPVFFSKGN